MSDYTEDQRKKIDTDVCWKCGCRKETHPHPDCRKFYESPERVATTENLTISERLRACLTAHRFGHVNTLEANCICGWRDIRHPDKLAWDRWASHMVEVLTPIGKELP